MPVAAARTPPQPAPVPAAPADDPGQRALARVCDLGLPLTPAMFELWHTYYADPASDLAGAVDALLASGQPITAQHCAEIVGRLSPAWSAATGQRVRETIEEIGQAVSEMGSAAADYRAHLTDASQAMRAGPAPSQIADMLKDLVVRTQEMVRRGAALEEVMDGAAETIDALQRVITQARAEALTDGLTGLSNRKAFDQRIARLVAEAAAEPEPELAPGFCLILLDIDHFKAFNDTYGHQLGDHVLRLVSRVLVDGIKGRDLAARYGGEEFAVLLPDTAAGGGRIVADALRRAVGDKDLVNRTTGERLGQITLSAGVAAYAPGQSVEEVIRAADAALYRAKCAGRDRTVVAGEAGAP